MKKISAILFALVLVSVSTYGLAVLVLDFNRVESPAIGSSQVNFTTTATTTAFVLSAGTAAQIAPTSTSRVFMRIVTTSTGVYLRYGGGAATVADGEPLSSPLVFDLDHIYTGAISALAPAGATVSVTHFTNP